MFRMLLKRISTRNFDTSRQKIISLIITCSNNRIGLLATQKLALGIAAHPNLKVLKVSEKISVLQ